VADNDLRAVPSAVYLLVRYPPVQSGRDVVGGWELEAWRGGDCAWSVNLAEVGVSYWADQILAQTVAARALRTRLVAFGSWTSCGSGHAPMFLARLRAAPHMTRRPDIIRRRPAGRERVLSARSRVRFGCSR